MLSAGVLGHRCPDRHWQRRACHSAPKNGTLQAPMNEPNRPLERLCQACAVLASVGFALAAFWELGDRFAAGHFAAASAVCTAGENMWRWGIAGPVIHQLGEAPASNEFYCHHPWGIFWVSALFM